MSELFGREKTFWRHEPIYHTGVSQTDGRRDGLHREGMQTRNKSSFPYTKTPSYPQFFQNTKKKHKI